MNSVLFLMAFITLWVGALLLYFNWKKKKKEKPGSFPSKDTQFNKNSFYSTNSDKNELNISIKYDSAESPSLQELCDLILNSPNSQSIKQPSFSSEITEPEKTENEKVISTSEIDFNKYINIQKLH